VRLMMSKERRATKKSGAATWIDITRDDFRVYDSLWKYADGEEDKKKRDRLDELNWWKKEKESDFRDRVLADHDNDYARTIWDL
jgi:hypothetical protein